MAGGKRLSKKKLTEPPGRVPTTKKPKCPLHSVEMEYEPALGYWKCTWEACTQIAFPPEVAEKGKPSIISGELELVHTPDPEGNKAGRWFLRSANGSSNTMMEVTDHLTGEPLTKDGDKAGFRVIFSLMVHNMTKVE